MNDLMKTCDCTYVECAQIEADLKSIPSLSHLANALLIRAETHFGSAVKKVSNLISPERQGKRSWTLLSWHYPHFCIDKDGNVRITCKENPDFKNGRGVKFLLADGNYPKLAKTQKDDTYISAPTVLPSHMQTEIVIARDLNRNHEINKKTKVIQGELDALSPAAKSAFEEEKKQIINEYEDKLRSLEETIQQLQIGNTKLEEENQKSKKESKIETNGVFMKGNLDNFNYWNKLTPETISSLVQFSTASSLFSYVQSVLWVFNSKMAPDFFKIIPDHELEIIFGKELRDGMLETALALTPSKNRDIIQNNCSKSFNDAECVLIALIHARLNIPLRSFAAMFSGFSSKTSHSTVSRILSKWIPRLGLIGRLLTSFEVSEEVARFLMPQSFITAGYGDVYCIIDARDIQTHKIRLSAALSRMLWSNKISCSAARVLVLCLPCGLIVFLAEPCFARADELQIFMELIPDLPLIPASMSLMGDRAYKHAGSLLPNHNRFLIPDSKPRGNKQFFVSQLDDSKNMSQLRYVIEAVNSRSASWSSADDVVNRKDFPQLTNYVFISFGMSIFMNCLQAPKGGVKYQSIIDSLVSAYAECKCFGFK